MENNSTEQKPNNSTNTEVIKTEPTPTENKSDTYTFNETTIMASLAYVGPLVLIPFLTNKNNPFITFHVKQGLVLFGIEIMLMFINMMSFYLLTPIIFLINSGLIILSIIGIFNVIRIKEVEIPIVGKMAHNINI
jgi:fumarate reductase subunit D